MNRERQTCLLGSPVQVGWGETGAGPTGGAPAWSNQEEKSWGREVEGAGLAQPGKEEAAISPQPATV